MAPTAPSDPGPRSRAYRLRVAMEDGSEKTAVMVSHDGPSDAYGMIFGDRIIEVISQ